MKLSDRISRQICDRVEAGLFHQIWRLRGRPFVARRRDLGPPIFHLKSVCSAHLRGTSKEPIIRTEGIGSCSAAILEIRF